MKHSRRSPYVNGVGVLAVLLIMVLALLLASCGAEDNSGKEAPEKSEKTTVEENGTYDSKEDVAEYLSIYKKLPKNYITKKEARKLGWHGGAVEPYAPGKCIGGDRFGNREKKLPDKTSRKYYECDIDTLGKKRGAKRMIYSNDGLIYYTGDHYNSFEKMPQSA